MAKKPEIPKLSFSAIKLTEYPIVTEIGAKECRDIGKVVSAHAVLENAVFTLLVTLSETRREIGRVVFRYQAASERFKTCRRLLALHGISTTVGLKKLFESIEESCHVRDQFAHGLWARRKDGTLGLRLTKGTYEVPDAGGMADRVLAPTLAIVPDALCDESRQAILSIANAVEELIIEVQEKLKKLRAKS